jgi:putative addiction module component (TIGR02574 family)
MDELLELSPEERIQIAEDLWDSIGPEQMPPLTAEQIREAERRMQTISATRKRHPGGRMSKRGYWRDIGELGSNATARLRPNRGSKRLV